MRSMLALVVAIVFLAAGCGSGSGSSSGDTTTTTAAAGNGCADVTAPDPRTPEAAAPPSAALDPSKTYTLTFDTSCGSFTVTLDPKLAPKTSASLVALAKSGYFDDTIFHRVVSGFVIQGGDPTQSGAGGPGYSTVDKPPASTAYTKGVVAMAKSPVEAPGTAGSQFFVVTGANANLPPDYAVVGKVTAGMDTVERIDALGPIDASGAAVDGPPTKPVVITSVTVGAS